MSFTEQLTQGLAIADVINRTNNDNTNTNSAGIDMSRGRRALYIIINSGGTGTIDGRLQAAANSNFNVVSNITGSNLNQTNTVNGVQTVEVRADQLPAGTRYVRLQLTGSAAAVNVQAIGFLGEASFKPASQFNLNSATLLGQVVVA